METVMGVPQLHLWAPTMEQWCPIPPGPQLQLHMLLSDSQAKEINLEARTSPPSADGNSVRWGCGWGGGVGRQHRKRRPVRKGHGELRTRRHT